SRRVVTGQHALDEVSWVDTRLSDAEVAGLFDGPSGDAMARVVRYRRGRLRIRPKWTTLEFWPRGKPKSREIEALVDSVAHIARAARGLPEDRASVSEDPFPASSFLVYLAIVY